ncbi:MAG: DUF2125 domain-containing protein [Alphaproteobacteria bacterium]|nr:DUF2125 domain-containing protein [Alphaproteobacteria bacterium]
MFDIDRRYLLLVALLLAACAGYAGYWHWVAHRVDRGLVEWQEARRAEGYEVDFGASRVTGFPGRLLLTIERAELADPLHHAAWRWRAPIVRVHAQPWNLTHLIADLGETQEFAWREREEPRGLALRMESARASIRLAADGSLQRFSADIARLVATGSGLVQPLTITRMQAHHRLAGPGEHEVALQLEGLGLPPEQAGPLGPHVGLARVLLALAEPLPSGPENLAAWRDGGGVVEVKRFELAWGPLDMRGEGTVTLDRSMRPLAALTSEIRGFAETIDGLRDAGRIKPNIARTARTALQLMARPGPDGKPVLNLPVTAQDGRLYVGPLELMEFGPLPMIGRRVNPS